MVFGLLPTRLQWCVEYLTEMHLNPQPDVKGFFAYFQAAHPQADVRRSILGGACVDDHCTVRVWFEQGVNLALVRDREPDHRPWGPKDNIVFAKVIKA